MASQSKLQSATTPSSRLSPLAQPFVFSHRQLALVDVSASSVNDSFSGLDKTWYSSEEGLGLTEQHDGAVNSNSMDDDQSLFRKENHAVEGSQLSGEAIGNLSRHLIDIPAAQVACHNRTNQLKPNLKGAEEGHSAVSSDDSFVVAEKDKIDNEDLDVDSPCWKGKNNKNSPFIVTETLDAEFTKSKPESSSILNPKAPQFLPRAVERRSSAPVSMSFKKKPSPSSPLFKNQVSWETTDVFNSDSTTGYFAMLYESEENSQNTHVDNMGGIDDSVIGPNMVMYGDGDCSLLVETLLQLSKSLSTQVGVDADILVDTIHALSELLLVNCSDRLFSEERQLEKIKRAINNLSLVSVKNKDGQSPSIHGSNVEFIQSYLTKSPHSSKLPGTEFQPARSKVVISPPHPEVSNLRKYELQPAKTKVVISPPEVSNLRKYELQPARTEVVISPPEASNLRKYELQPVKTKVVISPPEASNLRKYELQTARTEGVISPPKASNLTKYELLPARTKVVISPPLEASNLRKYELQKMGSAMIMQNFKSFSSDIGNEIAQATMNSSSLGYEMEHQLSPQASIYKDLWLQATQELHFINKKAWRNNES